MKPRNIPIPPAIRPAIKDSFFSKFRKDRSGCWLWTAGTIDGYGILYFKSKPYRATRLSWRIHHNWRHPGKLFVLHICDNPRCVNPAHLELGDARENSRQMVERRRHKSHRLADAQITRLAWGRLLEKGNGK